MNDYEIVALLMVLNMFLAFFVGRITVQTGLNDA